MSPFFISIGCLYLVLCFSLISIIIMQKKRNAGLGSLSGVGQSYWSKNKSNSFDGKLEKYTKAFTFLYIVLTVVLCFVK